MLVVENERAPIVSNTNPKKKFLKSDDTPANKNKRPKRFEAMNQIDKSMTFLLLTWGMNIGFKSFPQCGQKESLFSVFIPQFGQGINC